MCNCLFGGMGDDKSLIRVATSNGGVMEFQAPVTVESITDEFPGHGIFRSHDLFWKPLPHSDLLLAGESYHLLPVRSNKARVGHVRSNSAPPPLGPSAAAAPYRMSVDYEAVKKKDSSSSSCGFWKVKLVISAEQLVEILGEEGRTEELIESVRTVAKCGGAAAFGGFSDHWSLSSSRNAASSNKDSCLLEF